MSTPYDKRRSPHAHCSFGGGTALVPTLAEGETQTAKDFSSDQEVRWCPRLR